MAEMEPCAGCPSEGIVVTVRKLEGEVESLRVSRHEHGNALIRFEERLSRLVEDVSSIERAIQAAQAEMARQNTRFHDDLKNLSAAIPPLTTTIDKLRHTLLGADDDGGVKSRVAAVETAIKDQGARLKWIQWGVIGLLGLLGPEQAKLFLHTITGFLK
jgi:chromosome segregation ATPase